jgi:hypothetical protein
MAQERWRVCQNKQIRPDLDCRADRPKFDDGERASPAAEGETNEHEIEPRSPVVPYPLAKRKGNRRPSRIWATGKMFRPEVELRAVRELLRGLDTPSLRHHPMAEFAHHIRDHHPDQGFILD